MKRVRKAFQERYLVIILFVMVFAAFSFAQHESKKIEKLYLGFKLHSAAPQYTKVTTGSGKTADTGNEKNQALGKEYRN